MSSPKFSRLPGSQYNRTRPVSGRCRYGVVVYRYVSEAPAGPKNQNTHLRENYRMKQQLLKTAVAAVAATVTLGAAAQSVPAQFVVSGEAAAKILDATTINLATAERIATTCERLATENDVAISIYVLDNDGNHVYVHRMDGQVWTNIATAEMKAKTALRLREPSKALMNHVIDEPFDEWRQMELGLFSNAGGLPVVVNNQLIGAIGVGGSAARPPEWSDEICGHRALTEVIGPQPPLLEDIARERPPRRAAVPQFRAQQAPASSLPAEWVVSGANAARIFDGNQISGDAARRIAMSCRSWAAENGQTVSLHIMDTSGIAVHAERMDGQVWHDMETALLKAETARRSRSATSARSAGAMNNPTGVPRAIGLFDFYDEPGGLPIVVDGQMIGAIGVSGTSNNQDETCAVTGLKAVFGDRVLVPVYPQ
jgi:uncharacterized protein GlcG (DUF336 family)